MDLTTTVKGIHFYVNTSNSIVGTYPNVKHRLDYNIQIHHDYSANSTNYNGAVLWFGGRSHNADIHCSGIGTWTLASGYFEWDFGKTSNSHTMPVTFTTTLSATYPYQSVYCYGNWNESASFGVPSISWANLTTNSYQQISYSAGLTSNPYNMYAIRVEFSGGSTQVGTSGSWSGLSPNTYYTANFYVVWAGSTGSKVSGATARGATTYKPNAPTRGNAYASTPSWNQAVITWNGFGVGAGASDYYYQTSWDASTWYNQGKNTSLTLSNLKAYTTYTVYVRIVDNYGQVSANASVTFTTPKPGVPSKGSVSYTNLNPFGADLSWSGFYIQGGASDYYYQYSFNGATWTGIARETSIGFSNLTPETSYTFRIRIVDNFGQASDSASVTFVTLADQAKVALNLREYSVDLTTKKTGAKIQTKKDKINIRAKITVASRALKQTRLSYNNNGKVVKVKKVYYNDNGVIKVHQNFGG